VPRRRPHLARTTIGFLVAVAAWLGVVALALTLLELPASRAWLARVLAEKVTAAAGLPVRVGDVRVSLNPPRVVVHDVVVGSPEAPIVKVAVAEVLVGDVLLANREIGIDNLRLKGVVIDLEAPPQTKGSQGGGWIHLLVRQLELEDVQIRKVALPGGMVLKADGVEARWSGTRRAPISSAVVSVASVTLSTPGIKPISGSLMARGRKTAGGWEVGKLRGRGEGWSVDAHAVVGGAGTAAEGTARVELAQVERILDIGAGLTGSMTLTWKASIKPGEFRVEAGVTSPKAGVAGLSFGDLVGEIHLAPDGLEASVAQSTFAGGVLEASYTLGSFGPPWRHRIAAHGQGIDVEGFLHQLGVPDSGLAARGRMNAEVTWEGGAFKAGYGTGVTELQPREGDVPLAGRMVFSLVHDGALGVSTTNARLAGAPLKWEGKLALGTWLPSWKVQGERIPVASIARLLRGWIGVDVVPPQLTGEAALDIGISGPFTDLTVEGNIALAPVAFGPIDADGLLATFRAGQGVLSVDPGVIYIGAGRMTGRGELRYGSGRSLEVELTGNGVPLVRMVAWGGVHAPLGGHADFTGTVGGTLDDPRAGADLRLIGVALAGVPFGDGEGKMTLADRVVDVSRITFGPFSSSARIDLARREATVDAALSGFGLDPISPPLARMLGGELDCTLHGSFPFDNPSGKLDIRSAKGARGSVDLDAQGVRILLGREHAWRVAGELRRSNDGFAGDVEFGVESWHLLARDLAGTELPVEGHMAGSARVRLGLPDSPHVDGEVKELTVSVEGEEASLDGSAHFAVDGSAVRLDGAKLVGRRSSLVVRAARATDGTLSGNVSGELPGVLLGLVWREAKPSGRVELTGDISGTDSAPRFEGTARVTDGSLRIPGLPEPVTRINGELEFIPEAVKLNGVNFALLGGTGVCDGRIYLSPQLSNDLALRVDAVRWPLIPGLTPILTGEIRVVGGLQNLSISGRAVLKRTLFRRDIDLQRLVLEQARTPERVRATEGAPAVLNISVEVPSTLEVDTPLARLVAKGELKVTGTTARYGVLGRLEALPGGELEFSGNRYELDRGTLTFTSPDRVEPHLDLLARTTVQSYEVTVGLVGTLDRMTPTFTANPPLPEMDVISLISTGQKADSAGKTNTGTFASSFLLDEMTGNVTRRARTLLDVDQMRVDPFTATLNGNPTARLTVVKQLSRDWTVTVSANLTANREEVITSRWKLAQGVYLEANREQDGSYSLDVKWQRRY